MLVIIQYLEFLIKSFLLLLPIVTRQLTVDEFGIFVLFQAIASIILPISTLSIDSSILLNYYKIQKDKFNKYFFEWLHSLNRMFYAYLIFYMVN